jgi:hypothetical protein
MIQFIAEIKPLDILVPVVAVALTVVVLWIGISLVIGFFGLLLQPFYAVATRKRIEEDSLWLWFFILCAGLLYWQLS